MFMLTNRGERFSDIFVREGNKLLRGRHSVL